MAVTTPTNTLIVGDNLDVLPTLAPQSVDVVYIDPPYNTGNGFAYHDRHGTGVERHRMWVDMMRPRLTAAREVMANHAAIFVSIDDNEVAYLRLLLDEVFGERNFIAQVVVNLNPKGRQLGPFFATSHEYLLVYARDAAHCRLDPTSAETVKASDFPLTTEDGRQYRHLPLRNTNKKFNPITAPTLHYPLWGDPVSGQVATARFEGAHEILPVFGDGAPAVWRWSAPRVDERPDDLVCRVVRGKLGERIDVHQRDWLHEGRRKKLPTIWLAQEVGSTDTAVAELKQILGPVFASPKPTGLIRRVLDCFADDAVVLDFFAGSGTTGHATVLANLADGGTRRAILVNSAEPTQPGSSAEVAGYATVSEVTEARLRAVDALLGGGLVVQGVPAAVGEGEQSVAR
ncbi:site-specific DNA-methyltransferase [Nocardioides sp. Bht2]|uniref:site-specific DNA-methyltransferase n=1 Tax=Nocardioides sp. Bht2 TaxID=3392297 RepID=UPI0039B55ACB